MLAIMPSFEGISAIQIEHLELLTEMQFLVNKVIVPLTRGYNLK